MLGIVSNLTAEVRALNTLIPCFDERLLVVGQQPKDNRRPIFESPRDLQFR